jgi:hypothetical protein
MWLMIGLLAACAHAADVPSIADQKPNTWVKRSPVPGSPPSPRLGYEASWGYDPALGKMIRWGAHDPGGGGPQLSEVWTFDVKTCTWDFVRTNNNPPGNCCCRENVFDRRRGLFVRFSYPSFGHGWYWDRSRYLREDTVWTYSLARNRWTNMRPSKGPGLNVGKPAFYDAKRDIIWVYDTKLRTYDPYTNRWITANLSKEIGKRTYAGMALDPVRDKIVLFGDHYKSDPRTWVYDIGKDKWIDMKPKGATPPGIRSCPTMVYDSLNRKMILITLADRWDTKDAAKKRMETWVYDLGKNKWTKMDPPQEPDYSGTRGRLMRYLPDQNIVILEGRAKKEQQIWTYRLASRRTAPEPPVPTPTGLAVAADADNAVGFFTLTWQAVPKQVELAGYQVYCAEGDPAKPWKVMFRPLLAKPITATQFTDGILEFPRHLGRYRVTAVAKDGRESKPSVQVRTQPRLVVNSRVDALAKNKTVFSWEASKDKDVVGYVVERAVLRPITAAQKKRTVKQYADGIDLTMMVEKAALGQFVRLTPKPIQATSFTDTVDLSKQVKIKKISWAPWFGSKGLEGATKTYDMNQPGHPTAIYAYRVRAVNRLGVEGGDSPYQMTVPNEVEDFYGKEEGKGIRLRWSASPHRGIRGYLVYRLNERFASAKSLVLLTPKPIKETEYLDPIAGGKSRRYYIVVVDALGQQGIPSHPVWAFRPWGRHYRPWLPKDGWHQ